MQRALDFLQEHNEVALATVCNNKPEYRTVGECRPYLCPLQRGSQF